MQTIENLAVQVQGSKHLPELQSVRGIAALIVLLSHCMSYFAAAPWIPYVPQILLNSHAAVVVFFVLSGFVLCQSLSSGRLTVRRLAAFYVRRAFRIYPALFFASAFALCYWILFRGHSGPTVVSSAWIASLRFPPVNHRRIVESFLGLSDVLPLPTWTIFVEIVASFLMPFFVMATTRGRRASIFLILALGIVSAVGRQTRLNVGVYLVDFAIGASIPQFPELFRFLTRSTGRGRIALVVAVAGLLTIRQLGHWDFGADYDSPAASGLEALCAAALIGVIAYKPEILRAMRSRGAVELGDISYSVYLVHVPLMAFIAVIGGEMLRLPIFTAGGFPALYTLAFSTTIFTLLLSAASYRLVEVPGQKLGKRLTRLLVNHEAHATPEHSSKGLTPS